MGTVKPNTNLVQLTSLQRSDMSVEKYKGTFFRSSGAVCKSDLNSYTQPRIMCFPVLDGNLP